MATPPPLPPQFPPRLAAIPPVLPPIIQPDCGQYLNYCSNICFAVAVLLGFGCLVVGVERASRGGEGVVELVFVVGVGTFAAISGVLLRQRRRLGHPLAMVLFVVMLFGIPLGTVFGILGIRWLNKAQHLLR